MDQPCLKAEPREAICRWRLNNRQPVLREDRDDGVTHGSKVRIAALEVRVRLIHHHILAFRLSLRQSG